jgi:hypothetical protein
MHIQARLAALFLLLSFSTAAFTQQPPQPAPAQDGQIHLDVVVTPKSGPPVTGLDQKDFTITDNKVPATITSFRAFSGSEAPVEVILLIDAVNTDYQIIAYERNQIDGFLRANGGKLAHPVKLAISAIPEPRFSKAFRPTAMRLPPRSISRPSLFGLSVVPPASTVQLTALTCR